MNVTDCDNMTEDYKSNNCTINENNIDRIIPTLIFTKPCGLSFSCLLSLMDYTLIKTLFKKMMDKYPYPTHPVRCITTGPSEFGKSVFLTN